MRKLILLVSAFLFLAALKAYAYDNHDFQVWNTESEEFKISDNSKIGLEQEMRWGDNANQFFYQHYDIGYFYKLKKWLQLGGGYRHILELKSGKWKVEYQPYLSGTIYWKFAGCAFDSRSRLEYKHYEYQQDTWSYRNKFTMKLPWKFTKLEIQPFISDEIFVKFAGWSGFNQNRLSGGLAMKIFKNLNGEIYYMLQSLKSAGVWKENNVLGTKFKAAF
jgi:hypothetical protein